MTPERWEQVSRVYESALDQPPGSRAAFVADACQGDSDLRREVESLLAREQAHLLVDQPVDVAAAAVLMEARALAPGTTVGPYRVTDLIGEGGMGQVYRAHDTKLQRDVALKILPDAFVHDRDRVARFTREAQVLASLNHPNIGAIYGFEDSGEVHALVLELVDGPTLADRIARGPIPVDEALAIARQIAEALEAAHEHGIVHRDLKPANIKVRDDGMVKVLDFGLAKPMEGPSKAGHYGPQQAAGEPDVRSVRLQADLTHSPTIMSPAMTAMGVILGTAAYMSPEQAKGKPADKRSDIWAFGCVLYEMLTGKRAFNGDDVSDTLAAVLRAEPDWGQLPPATPSSLRRLLRRCLQRDQRRRLPSIGAARLDIDDALEGDTSERSSSPEHGLAAWKWMWAMGAVLLLAAIGGSYATLRYPGADSRDARPLQFTFAQPANTTFRGNYGRGPTDTPHIAISPDGQSIVFVAVERGVPALWLRSLGSLDTIRLPGTERAAYPFWSPDSRSVAFFAEGKLKKLLVNGGRPIVVCDAEFGLGGTWNNDDIILFAPGGFTVDGRSLKRVSASGGPVTDATTGGGDEGHGWPQFLPDGRHFLYVGWTGQEPAASDRLPELRLGSLDSAETTTLFHTQSAVTYAAGHLFFWRDGSVLAQPFDAAARRITGGPFPVADQVGLHPSQLNMAFTASESGVIAYGANVGRDISRLVWMDRAGHEAGTLGEPGEYGAFDLAPDERRVAVTLDTGLPRNRDVYIIDAASNVTSRFTFDPENDAAPIWSPDGTHIIFQSTRNSPGSSDLYLKSAAGAAAEEAVLDATFSQIALDWSPDGRFIVYRQVTRDTDLWILPLASKGFSTPERSTSGQTAERADMKPFPFVEDRFPETNAVFSPDGRFIAYDASESSADQRAPSAERQQVFVQPFPATGARFQISRNGGRLPRWSRNGELFFQAPDGTMMSTSIKTGPPFEFATPKPLFQTGLTDSFAVTNDGQRFLVMVPEEAEATPLTVVVNWQAALKR